MTAAEMRADFAAFERDFYARHPRTWSSLADTLDDFADDRNPADDAMYFRAAPYHGRPL